MKKLSLFIALLTVALVLQAQSIKLNKKDLKTLYGYMQGNFSSLEQSLKDTSYFNISLKMTKVKFKNTQGYWLYVEQAMATALDKPYRQRIYHLYANDDTTIVSKVYELKNSKQYIGGNNNKKLLKNITIDSLMDRQGCSIYLHKNAAGNYVGSTPSKECLSNLRGATYATSEVIIYPNKLESWDRGWNNNDKQVWGAQKGGYIFVKTK
jgi:CpeT protein